jgi:signal transduction histidine kinase
MTSRGNAPRDPSVELAVHRIAREALTNARRHAPGAAADVELGYCDSGVRIRQTFSRPVGRTKLTEDPRASSPVDSVGTALIRVRELLGGVVQDGHQAGRRRVPGVRLLL